MPLTGKYLKYSPEITLEIFTLIWNKLIEHNYDGFSGINTIFSNFKNYKINICIAKGTNLICTSFTSENLIETTVQEILGYDPFVKDDFVLPEKWCIKHTNNKELCKFFEDYNHGGYNGSSNNFFHYPRHDGSKCLSPTIKPSYTEITFEQFKKYVLKESIETPKEVIPEYVECIENKTQNPVGIELGKIYKVLSKIQCNCKTNSDTYILDCKGSSNKICWDCNKKLPDNAYMASRFKPLTKEVFNAQNKPKSIEKWSVGSYVVFLKDNLQNNSRKKEIYQK